MTPRTSVSGILEVSGASASKMNLLTPIGIGPTRRESSSWSCSSLREKYVRLRLRGVVRLTGEELTRLQIRHKSTSTRDLDDVY